MSELNESIKQALKKLAGALQLNEQELTKCEAKIMQLGPDQQHKFLDLLSTIKNQIAPINVTQLNKIKTLIPSQHHSGLALLSHINLCFKQNQLIASSLNQTRALVEQAYKSSNQSTKKKSIKNEDEDEDENKALALIQTIMSGKSMLNAGGLPMNIPVLKPGTTPKPGVLLLVKLIQILRQIKIKQNMKNILDLDVRNDNEIIRKDNLADKQINRRHKQSATNELEKDRKNDNEILRLDRLADKQIERNAKQDPHRELNKDDTIEKQIEQKSMELNELFILHQNSIKNALESLRAEVSETLTNESEIKPQFGP